MKITIQAALNKLKLLDSRIHSKLGGGVKLFSFEEDTKPEALLESFNKLVTNRLEIQTAIQVSNTTTQVTISGRTMSVAYAIALKNSLQDYTPLAIRKLQRDLSDLTQAEEHYDATEDLTIKTLLETSVANNTQFDEKAVRASINKSLTTKLDIAGTLKEMTEEQENFLADVDLALTTSNVLTEIEISE